jgi:hypothetical protein
MEFVPALLPSLDCIAKVSYLPLVLLDKTRTDILIYRGMFRASELAKENGSIVHVSKALSWKLWM